MAKKVRLSKKYGTNSSIAACECCGEEYGVIMFGTSWKDPETGKTAQAPHKVYKGFCDKCQAVVDGGGLLIVEIKDGEKGPNPYRTGKLVGITKEAKERIFEGCDAPMSYMEEYLFEPMFGEFCKKKEDESK